MKIKRHTNIIKLVGENVKYYRNLKGITQSELAYSADFEISQISRIERGVINTSISQLYTISLVLEIDVKLFFDFTEKE